MIRFADNPSVASSKPMSMATESDETLIQRAKSGCHVAFADLVRQHQSVVRAVLARVLRDDNEVDELAQRVFVSAYQSLKNFRGESEFSSWLASIARRQAAMYIRGEVRRRQRESTVAEIALAEWTNQLTSDDEAPAEKLAALSECLKQLPETSHDVIQRFYFEREAIDSIASGHSRTPGAIRMMLMRIRQTLAKCVSGRLAGPEEMQ